MTALAASAHHSVQADAGLSDRVRAVRGVPCWSISPGTPRRLITEQITPDRRCRDHRPGRAVPPGRHPPAASSSSSARSRRPGGSSLYLVTTPRGRGSPAMSDRCRPAFWKPRLDGNRHRRLERRRWRRARGSRAGRFSCRRASASWSDATSRSASGLHDIVPCRRRWSLAIVIVLGVAPAASS